MSTQLLIIGAGVYGLVAKEIAESMGCFDTIAFADDAAHQLPDGTTVVGKVTDIGQLGTQFSHAVVAIGNPQVRRSILQTLEEHTSCTVARLVSPQAYVAPSAVLGAGCIVEPMAVVHTGCTLDKGCLISAGAVVNHGAHLCETVHVDCNATVLGGKTVPAGTKVESGTVFK